MRIRFACTTAWLPIVRVLFPGQYPQQSIFSLFARKSSSNLRVDKITSPTGTSPSKQGHRQSKVFKEFPFPYHSIVQVRIESITNLGEGVGRAILPDGSKWVVFSNRVLPGELVNVRIFENNSGHSKGDLVEVLESSPDRVTPLCEHFSSCGGCQYQHMSIAAQRRWKLAQVETALHRIGGISQEELQKFLPTKMISSAEEFGYRSKITPHATQLKNGQVIIGFMAHSNKTVVDVEVCPIATPNINVRFMELRDELKSWNPPLEKGHRSKTLLLREVQGGRVETDANTTVSEEVGGIVFHYRTTDFFQNNPFLLPLLVEHVVSMASGEGIDFLIDTFCGSGLFALSAASKFQSVYGVEISEHSVVAAIANAKSNGIRNAKFTSGPSEQIFRRVQELDNDRTAVILDPPRKGCEEDFLAQLFLFRPKKIVYVSCDPATQARDAKMMLTKGYRVAGIMPFDMFPQTRHIENVLTLIRDP